MALSRLSSSSSTVFLASPQPQALLLNNILIYSVGVDAVEQSNESLK